VDALSNGKNVWSFQPFVAATWLNTGDRVRGLGRGKPSLQHQEHRTDYQTAPAIQLEGAVVQRIRSGWGFRSDGLLLPAA
jgi:hypothetical protein